MITVRYGTESTKGSDGVLFVMSRRHEALLFLLLFLILLFLLLIGLLMMVYIDYCMRPPSTCYYYCYGYDYFAVDVLLLLLSPCLVS